LPRDQNRKWVSAIIWLVNFANFKCIVRHVKVNNKFSNFAEKLLSIIPNRIKSQNDTIQGEKFL